MTAFTVAAILFLAAGAQPSSRLDHRFILPVGGEAVASITAGCDRCDWGLAGREAVVVRVTVDGDYSQHLILARGASPASYRLMLGRLAAGPHRLTLERDTERSSRDAGAIKVQAFSVHAFREGTPEHEWLSHAPFLYARPGTVERFSDLPVMMWVERTPPPADDFRYTVIFTHEDGGTPTDRLMATWGRTTDIEFVYSTGRAPDGVIREEIQGKNHEILPFRGRRFGAHPLLWVATDNNMVADSGPETIRFGLAPELVSLENVSREAVMDANPWTYSVMSAELRREGRLDPAAKPGSAKVPDSRRFAYLEGCGELDRATAAFDVAIRAGGGATEWHATDRGDPRFRIARSGCFRAAVPLPPGTTVGMITGVRMRAFTRPPREDEPALPPGTGRVTLQRLNGVFMLDQRYRPGTPRLRWAGTIETRGEAEAVRVPVPPSAGRTR